MFDTKTPVTPSAALPRGALRPLGVVTSHATDPFTGEKLNMVLWDGMHKSIPYHDDELTIANRRYKH
ncbi:hypothetical protein [Streptomyces violascens]|uniref:Uncharacterized protein n=1 Tax=Streptomyces violascens TaxID=67381 RepID=A0ABQ3QUY0_9ACTN|nr:hypothetical protein [Streptomyces violascens]GHI41093.1 hypothetical protein Sviol_55010 [Streptomyces violascens]